MRKAFHPSFTSHCSFLPYLPYCPLLLQYFSHVTPNHPQRNTTLLTSFLIRFPSLCTTVFINFPHSHFLLHHDFSLSSLVLSLSQVNPPIIIQHHPLFYSVHLPQLAYLLSLFLILHLQTSEGSECFLPSEFKCKSEQLA